MNYEILTNLSQKLKQNLDFELSDYVEIDAGMSNKLYRLSGTTGRQLLLKVYWNDPSDPRLEREFKALELMRQNGITQIPQPYFMNENLNYGVYSLEQGTHKTAENLDQNDIKKMVDFLVAVHSIKIDKVDPVFRRDSNYTLSIYAERKKHRIDRFLKALEENQLPDYVLRFNEELHPINLIEEKFRQIKENSGSLWDQNFPETDLRLSPQDFGPHNCLFNGNEITFLDFEYFCFIDPLFLVAEFTQHDKTFKAPIKLKQQFLELYSEKMHLTEQKKRRLELLIEINKFQWMSIFLDSMIPSNLDQFRFSIKNFNEEQFIKGQINKFKGRLSSI